MSEVATKIIEIIAKEMKTEPGKITLESSLEDLKIESLDVVQIVFAIEEAYDITIPNDKDYELNTTLKTVGDIVKGVERLVAQKKSGSTPPAAAAQGSAGSAA
jgi:acyl carrier protein